MSSDPSDPLEPELQRQAAVGRLLASVAHEIAAPLGSILSNRDIERRLLERISEAAGDASKVTQLVGVAQELAHVDRMAGERILKLVRSLKIAARVASPEAQAVNLNEIVDSSIELAKTEFRSRITVETDFGELPEVECFPHLVSQAVLNLLTNAGQAIQGPGKIAVGTRLEGEAVHIWVTDTGSGIRPEDCPKVLKCGFTTKPLGVGTGLGLLIVERNIAGEHGGTVEFESELGRGTTFHLRIPLDRNRKEIAPSA